MPDGHMPHAAQRSLLWAALGRQRVGKTALLNAAVQYFRAQGIRIEVWNADQQNRTHSLSTFFADAAAPPEGGLVDGRVWIEGRLVDQVKGRYHAVLDAGGGWTGFSSLIEDVPVIDALGGQGTDVIGSSAWGRSRPTWTTSSSSPRAGPSCRRQRSSFSTRAWCCPAGPPRARFRQVVASKVVVSALSRGARIVMFPRLGCMAEVTDRGISFADAAIGKVKPGQEPMSLFDPVRVNEWWTRKVPEFFAQFPREWLPTAAEAAKAARRRTRSDGRGRRRGVGDRRPGRCAGRGYSGV